MVAQVDRHRVYLIAIVAIVAIAAVMISMGGEKEPIGFISDEQANIGGQAHAEPALSGEGNAFLCVDSEGVPFRSVEPCR